MAVDIRVVEVGARDGLQNEPSFKSLPEENLARVRADFVIALADAGIIDVEAGAFVRPDKIPQMAATDKVLSLLQSERPDLWNTRRFWVLVPNMKGLELAMQAGAKHISVFTATSNAFNERNIKMSIEDSLSVIADITSSAKEAGVEVRGYVSTVWGCPYTGDTDPKKAIFITEKLLEYGVSEVSLGDTIGVATPNRVNTILREFQKDWPLAVHFHDTRGTAIANCLRAIDEGIRVVDSSAGGLGGCPYAKGASGNLATEDLLYMLHGMEYNTRVGNTRIDTDRICEAGEVIAERLQLHLPSRFHSAWKAAQRK